MTGLRLRRAVREGYGLTASALPGQIAEIRRLLATVQGSGATPGGLQGVHAGQLQAAWLINSALSLVADRYQEDVVSDAFAKALQAVRDGIGHETVEGLLMAYADAFVAGSGEAPGSAEALREIVLLWLANVNPAFAPMRELFDDAPLRAIDGYERLITGVASYFAQQPPFGPDHQPLIAMLRSPAVAFPDSLQGQLTYIRERWSALLGELLERMLRTMDVLNEEERAMWLRLHGGGALAGRPGERPGVSMPVYDFSAYQGEQEAFTPDRDWHPRLVLIAKSVYVWLDQLSRKYGRHIRHLDDIPDEELDRLTSWGVNGLWLIGIWQRSRASEQIKRYRGNPDAAASAYALDDYRVADDLGGEESWTRLSERASQRGLRLAADMVPNHMGIDSRWVIEHPEWFISLSEPPYPAYRYTGPELSPDPNVSIMIEDHYWDGSDAAVVFRWQDGRTGETRYIYHGNDGTVMPWNDTAQLNYIDSRVREQVIQTILAVARRFPVIRFDAAMVLTRQHMRRLWWPEPGSGGAIPSRSEHSISAAAFDQAMPGEFWRDVVDRVAAEGLDTLLLAEAFWLLEGYFVRTLGMHRVYNSAFMNMLRDERNAEYHLVMRNTLEFDPEVLKRFVNFMSNPDEDTAVEQFGKGDKYFGVCTLLATLPGLPMFGHGQIEGFAEKYGMEYRRAYYDEPVDEELVARHEREIFPLLRRRAQFAEVQDFLLYEFEADGGVNENVFAFSNGRGGERSLIIFHNTYASTAGAIRRSVQFTPKDGENRSSVRRTLAEGLGLPADPEGLYVTFREGVTGLEYVRSAREIRDHGLWFELGAYQRSVFLDFQDVYDAPGAPWRRLAERLAGRGVPSLADALDELILESVQEPFRRIASPAIVRALVEAGTSPDVFPDELRAAIYADMARVGTAAAPLAAGDIVVDEAHGAAMQKALDAALVAAHSGRAADGSPDPLAGAALVVLVAARALAGPRLEPEARVRYLDRLRLTPSIEALFRDVGADASQVPGLVAVTKAAAAGRLWPSERTASPAVEAQALLRTWLSDASTREALGVNRYQDADWLGAEAFENVVRIARAAETMRALEELDPPGARARISRIDEVTRILLASAAQAGYRVDALQAALRPRDGAIARTRALHQEPSAPPAREMPERTQRPDRPSGRRKPRPEE